MLGGVVLSLSRQVGERGLFVMLELPWCRVMEVRKLKLQLQLLYAP